MRNRENISGIESGGLTGLSGPRVLGVDPGRTGAMALLEMDPEGRPQLREVVRMPLEDGDGKRVDARGLVEAVRTLRPDVAVIERVGAAPGQGAASMFAFGRSLGLVEGAVAGLDWCQARWVAPNVWKPSLRLSGGVASKHQSVEMARRLWPEMAGEIRGDGEAEAALIGAYWCVRWGKGLCSG